MRLDTRNHAIPRILLLSALLVVSNTAAHAVGFHFWPANLSVQAKPGQTLNRTFNLTLAKESKETRFQARVEDWWRSEDNNRTFYAAPGTLQSSCGKWCSINPVETSVKPGGTMAVKVTLRIPEDAKPGGYWAALTVDEVPDPLEPKPRGVGMAFRGSVSVGIFVEVEKATRAASIAGVRVTGEKVGVSLRNDGNIPLRMNATFEFYQPGEDKPLANVKISGEPLLPEPYKTCEFSRPLPSPTNLPSGRYKVRVLADVGLDYMLGAENEIDITRSQ